MSICGKDRHKVQGVERHRGFIDEVGLLESLGIFVSTEYTPEAT